MTRRINEFELEVIEMEDETLYDALTRNIIGKGFNTHIRGVEYEIKVTKKQAEEINNILSDPAAQKLVKHLINTAKRNKYR